MKKDSTRKIGNAFENYLAELFKNRLDRGAKITYGSGSGLDKQDIILPAFGIEIEAKNQKTIKILDWWEQCKRQEFGNTGVLIFNNPRKPNFFEPLVVISIDHFVELVLRQVEETTVESNFNPKLKWKVANLKRAAQEVFKELE